MAKRLDIVRDRQMNRSQKDLILLRKKLSLSQKSLALEFAVTPGAIACWELGVNPIPGPVQKLVQIYLKMIRENCLTLIVGDPGL